MKMMIQDLKQEYRSFQGREYSLALVAVSRFSKNCPYTLWYRFFEEVYKEHSL